MKNHPTFPVLALVLFLITLTSACKKEKINNGDQDYAIQLTIEKINRNAVLHWTKINSTDFVEYVLIRSTEPIPDDAGPSSGIITRIDSFHINTFEDIDVPFDDSTYYKVYANIGDRFLSSPSVLIEHDIALLDFAVNNVVFDANNHLAYLWDFGNSTLHKYNYASNTILCSAEIPASEFNILLMTLGNHGEGNELYLYYELGNIIRIYSADDLSYKTNITASNSIYSLVSGNNDFLYMSTNSLQQKAFSVYRRSTKQFVSGAASEIGNIQSTIGVLGEDGTKVLVVNPVIITLLSINEQGQNTIIKTVEMPIDIFTGTPRHIRTSKDGEFFFPTRNGTVMNSDLVIQGSLSNNPTTNFIDFVFSDNKEKIWGLTNTELIEVSFPSFVENSRIALNYQALNAIKDGNDIIIVGIVTDSLTGAQKTIFDRITVE